MTGRWPHQAGGRRIQGHYHGKVVGTLQKWPAKAGGRSPKGPAVAGTSVPVLESSVMSGPEKIRSRGSWSHIVSKATDA